MPPRANEHTTLIDGGDSNVHYVDSKMQTRSPRMRFLLKLTGFLAVLSIVCVLVSSSKRHFVYRPPADRINHHKPTYDKVQGMGFQIYTGGAPAFLDNNVANPECTGRDSYGQVVEDDGPQIQCYLGKDNPVDDVQARVKIMGAAVERAFALADPDPTILKVFVAPEFFWRGVLGAYVFADEEENECGAICQVLQGLETIVADERFEHWLFVFGTVVASERLPDKDPYDDLFYNFAPVYKGYDPKKSDYVGKRFLVPKRYLSSSDFLTPERHLNKTLFEELVENVKQKDLTHRDKTVFNPKNLDRRRYDIEMWRDYKQELTDLGYTMIEYDWLMLDGVSLTIEICFDHDQRSALNTYLADMATGSTTRIPSSTSRGIEFVRIPSYQAQVSIVSSAGMSVTENSLALANGGVMFLQDGLSNETNRMFWENDEANIQYCNELGLQFEGGTEAVQRRAILSSTEVFFDHNVLDGFKRYMVYETKQEWEAALNGTFSTSLYPPQITLYEPVDIAKV